MKNLKLVLGLTLLFTFLAVVRCSKSSDPAPLVGISGTVTYTDPSGTVQKAAGAVVYLAKSTTATTTYDQSTIAGSDGTYSFSNLSNAGYYINAVYQSDNKNTSARIDGVTFTTAKGFLVTLASKALTQDIPLESVGSSTAYNIQVSYQYDSTASSGKGGYTNTGAWTFDDIHSPVTFSFPFVGQSADFGGQFFQTKTLRLNLNTGSLSSSSIYAVLDLASVDTGTPGGRDNLPVNLAKGLNEFNPSTTFTSLGCIAGTFGITADVGSSPITIAGSYANRYAVFSSTSISAYGNGYVANGNLTFHGATKSVSMIFNFVPAFTTTSTSGTTTNHVGISGKLAVNALADFNIVQSDILSAPVNVYLNVNVTQ